jgi:hypothetical protein
MTRRLPRGIFRLAVIAFVILAFTPALAPAQVVVKVNDNVNFRFGLQFQGWADWTEDANSQAYSQNLLVRRIRFIMDAHLAKNVSVFYQTDDPRIGNSGTTGVKNICSSGANCPASGFITQDALMEWKLAGDALMLDGGLFLVPTSRNGLTSTQAFLGFDIGTWALQGNTLEQGNGGRDYGVGLKGYVVDDRLEYRLAVFDGLRNPTTPQTGGLGARAGSRNPYRVAGRLNYDFFDLEKAGAAGSNSASATNGYVYAGTNRGTKKVVAVGVWGDGQGAYKAYGGDFMFDWPIMKDAITITGNYDHFEQNITTTTLPKQNDIYADAGYYFDAIKIQPFFVYQKLNFSDQARKTGNQQRYGGGINWYVSAQNLKLSIYYQRIAPEVKPVTAKTKDTNEVTIQLQAVYF